MLEQIEKPDDRDEWLTVRHSFFNASQAAALLDRHPFTTIQDVISEKLAPGPISQPENSAMIRGRLAEPFVADWYSIDTGIDLYEPTVMYANSVCLATLDRLPTTPDGTAIEIKTTAKRLDGYPERYWTDQTQMQMHCAGLDAVHLVAVDATWKLSHWLIERDDALIAAMVERAEHIMAAVSEGEWPAGIPTVQEVRERPAATAIELDSNTLSLVEDLATVREQLRDLKIEEDLTRRALLAELETADVGEYDGQPVVRKTWTSRSQIDTRRLKEDHPDLVANYETQRSWATLRTVSR
jgi:putative phage-type endonuclease